MTKKQKTEIRERLMDKLAQLSAGDRRHELITDWSNEPMDQIQSRNEMDLAVRLFDSDYQTRRAVETAIRSLDEGEYGICQDCGEEINPKRLEAIAWTTLCVSCQEEHDELEPTDEKLKRAA